MLENALRTFLLSKTAIAALIGTKVQVGDFVPLKPEDMPVIGIESDEIPSQQSLDGTACDLQFPVYRIVGRDRLYLNSERAIRLVRQAFLGVPLGMSVTIMDNGAPVTVKIEQVDLLSEPYNGDEEDYGHGFTIKPRILKIRVGWREPVTSI